MKIFSADAPRRVLDKRRAWACVAMNQLAFPGLGTLMAGRRAGYPQAVVMVTGFLLFTGPFLWIIYRMMQALLQPNGDIGDSLDHYRHYWPWLALGGGLCGAAWVWSLWSGIAILRDVKKLPPLIQRVPPLIREHEHKTPPLLSA